MTAARWVTVLAGLMAWQASPASAAEVPLSSGVGGHFTVKVVSLKEARFKTVIKQKYDFSCGSAALATLLTYHYGLPTTEEEVFQAMFATGDQAKIQKVGFSLLDMKEQLARQGFNADGFKITLDRLTELGVPAIALTNVKGYRHFVVLKGVRDDKLVVGDPATGVRVLRKADFEKSWNGIAFLIRNRAAVGREHFNTGEDWSVQAKAPLGSALNRQSLASFTMELWRGANEY